MGLIERPARQLAQMLAGRYDILGLAGLTVVIFFFPFVLRSSKIVFWAVAFLFSGNGAVELNFWKKEPTPYNK